MVTIHRVGGDRGFRRRLMELGLVSGTRVQLISVAPLGDPLELLVRGCSLSIRRGEAMQIQLRTAEASASLHAHPCSVCVDCPRPDADTADAA